MTKHILNKLFWENRYKNGATGWDMGEASPPFKFFMNQIEDKNLRILTPGGGSSYEAEFLIHKGFTNVTVVDIATEVTNRLHKKFEGNKAIQIFNENFFDHNGQYDLIFEQTFFCALSPSLREEYVDKMYSLLADKGHLFGLLFTFDNPNGPPFGGSKEEYQRLFKKKFVLHKMEACYNSHPARIENELWINLEKL